MIYKLEVPRFDANSETIIVDILREYQRFYLCQNNNLILDNKENKEYKWYSVVVKNDIDVKCRVALCKTKSKRFSKQLVKLFLSVAEYNLFMFAKDYDETMTLVKNKFGEELRWKVIFLALDYYKNADKIAQYTSISKKHIAGYYVS